MERGDKEGACPVGNVFSFFSAAFSIGETKNLHGLEFVFNFLTRHSVT
jgi:hypothetical protein